MRPLFAFLLSLLIAVPALAQDKDFHAPSTDAEKALNNIFNNYNKDANLKISVTKKFLTTLKNRDMSYNRLACIDDITTKNQYKTLNKDNNEAIITVDHSGDQSKIPSYIRKVYDFPLYKIIKTPDGWKMDGMYCLEKNDLAIKDEFEVNISNEAAKYCGDIAMSQWAMDFCAKRQMLEAKAKMEEALAEIKGMIKDNPDKIKRLEAAQSSWEKSFNDELDFLYYDHDGSNKPQCEGDEAKGLYIERTKHLQELINRVKHDYACFSF